MLRQIRKFVKEFKLWRMYRKQFNDPVSFSEFKFELYRTLKKMEIEYYAKMFSQVFEEIETGLDNLDWESVDKSEFL